MSYMLCNNWIFGTLSSNRQINFVITASTVVGNQLTELVFAYFESILISHHHEQSIIFGNSEHIHAYIAL